MQVGKEEPVNWVAEIFYTNELLKDGRTKVWVFLNGLRYLGYLQIEEEKHFIYIPELQETMVITSGQEKRIQGN